MKFLARKRLKSLLPVDAAGEEFIGSLPKDDLLWCEVTRPRNVGFHRKFFALLRVVREATGAWPSEDAQLVDLKFNVGHTDQYEIHVNGGRERVWLPRSISFAKMDDLEFSAFFERCMEALCELAGGIEVEAVREAVLEEIA